MVLLLDILVREGTWTIEALDEWGIDVFRGVVAVVVRVLPEAGVEPTLGIPIAKPIQLLLTLLNLGGDFSASLTPNYILSITQEWLA